ncbi:MAG: CRISPR-associated endonuclease Cas6 [Bacteroidota bacterium]
MNQKNHTRYNDANELKILQARGSFTELSTHFRNTRMIAFDGMFEVNADLRDYFGLGKQESRGLGTIKYMR